MKLRSSFPLTVGLATAAFGLLIALPAPAADKTQSVSASTSARSAVERGRYLVTTSGCNDCHTPLKMGANGPEPDMSRMLSGHPEALQMPPAPKLPEGPWLAVGSATNTAWSGPWGVSFTANLTPDAETGLGRWTLADFTAALRTGRHQGRGRPILPPMPVQAVKHFTDADLGAIYAYLRSIPAVSNRVPEPLPPNAPVAAK